MCTGMCWVYGCRRCGGTIYKDTSVAGHTCNAARRNRNRGCCRTGIEFTYYRKKAEELCVLCEVSREVDEMRELCVDEMREEDTSGGNGNRNGGEKNADEDDDEGGVSLSKGDDENRPGKEETNAEDGGVKLGP
ncbi:hypothetical protein K445DRAFT_24078 [Daldinia sp. EC12]|nr:hypothetical protein K445DRAFT_24078 [Daldinia sp. EC12]